MVKEKHIKDILGNIFKILNKFYKKKYLLFFIIFYFLIKNDIFIIKRSKNYDRISILLFKSSSFCYILRQTKGKFPNYC